MKIAVFYENILEGINKEGLQEEEVLRELHHLGMELVYIGYDNLEAKRDILLPLFAEIGLKVEGLHWTFDFGLHPENQGYKRVIDLAKEAGAGNILIVPGMISREQQVRREQLLLNMKKALADAVKYGEEKGIAVSMEDYDSLEAPYNSLEGLKWFLDGVEGLKCSFDTGNFVMYHQDEWEAFRLLRDKICTLHLKDRSETPINLGDGSVTCADGKIMYSAPVGSGCMKIAEILQELDRDGYTGNVIVELFGYTHTLDGIRQSIEWLKRKCFMIRKAAKEDASRLAEILIFAKRGAYRPIFRNDFVSFNEMSVLDTALHFRDNPEALGGIYVYDDGIVRGMMHIEEYRANGQGRAFQLKELYVDYFFQRQGIGRKLMRGFLDMAREGDADSVFLWVLEKNTAAIKFYTSAGFRATGERRQEPGTTEYLLKYERDFAEDTAVFRLWKS